MITMKEAIETRHSVRAYQDKPIAAKDRVKLANMLEIINQESGLNITIVYDDPEGFDSRMAHYGKFKNVNNYIVLKGKNCKDFDERCGYYGEKLVLEAQRIGLNTCWVALTFNKKQVKKMIPKGEKFCMVIAIGYGETQGTPHKGKTLDQVLVTKGAMPGWFADGVHAALLAPTAMNQQKFVIGMIGGEPAIRIAGSKLGICVKTDLGIVKYHFEAASGCEVK